MSEIRGKSWDKQGGERRRGGYDRSGRADTLGMVAASLSSYTLYSTYSQLYIDIQYSTVQYIRYVEVFNRDGRAVLVFFS